MPRKVDDKKADDREHGAGCQCPDCAGEETNDRMDDRVEKCENRLDRLEKKLGLDEEDEEDRIAGPKADDKKSDDRLGQSDADPGSSGGQTIQGEIPPAPSSDVPGQGEEDVGQGSLPKKDRVPFSVR